MADDYWQEQPGLDDSASQWHGKTTPEGFPSTQLLSTELRHKRRNDVKKGEKGEKVGDWVNSVYPCHMSLVNQFPHCSLFTAISSSDTKTTNTHPQVHGAFVTLGAREHVKQKVSVLLNSRLAGCQFTEAVSPHSSSFTVEIWNNVFTLLWCISCRSGHRHRRHLYAGTSCGIKTHASAWRVQNTLTKKVVMLQKT